MQLPISFWLEPQAQQRAWRPAFGTDSLPQSTLHHMHACCMVPPAKHRCWPCYHITVPFVPKDGQQGRAMHCMQ